MRNYRIFLPKKRLDTCLPNPQYNLSPAAHDQLIQRLTVPVDDEITFYSLTAETL